MNFDVKTYFSPFIYGGVTSETIKIFDRVNWLLMLSGMSKQYDHFFLNTKRYIESRDLWLSSHKINEANVVELVKIVNNILTPSCEFGFRDCESFVSNNNVRYYFSNHEKIPSEIFKIAERYLRISNIDDAINFFVDFTELHPFRDGNGRTARFLFEISIEEIGKSCINPYMYFLTDRSNFKDEKSIIIENLYKSVEWGISKRKNIEENVSIFKEKIAASNIMVFDESLIERHKNVLSAPFYSVTEVMPANRFIGVSNREVTLSYSKNANLVFYKDDLAVELLEKIDSIIFNLD